MSSTTKHDLPPQAEDSPEVILESDLHSLFTLGKAILGTERLPDALAFRIEQMVLAIAGCKICGRLLGDRHGGECGVTLRDRVRSFDLPANVAQTGSGEDSGPF